jgi:hypothetical protein
MKNKLSMQQRTRDFMKEQELDISTVAVLVGCQEKNLHQWIEGDDALDTDDCSIAGAMQYLLSANAMQQLLETVPYSTKAVLVPAPLLLRIEKQPRTMTEHSTAVTTKKAKIQRDCARQLDAGLGNDMKQRLPVFREASSIFPTSLVNAKNLHAARDTLVPIRLGINSDINVPNHDILLWDANQTTMSPYSFAHRMAIEMKLSPAQEVKSYCL